GRRAGCDGVGSDEAVRVAVADHLQVKVIRGPAAGEHGVQLLPGLLSGGQAVHGVGGDALGAVDGRGVAETGRGLSVVGGEPVGAVAAVVSNGQVAAATYSSNGPAVTVFDPVVSPEAVSAVVGARDDHIADTGLFPVRQAPLAAGRVTAEKMITGLTVEVVDELTGGGEHDRV